MKISEIKKNMFGLSDLRGLINENAYNEGVSRWDRFFEAYPEYLDPKYDTMDAAAFFADNELRDKIRDFGFKFNIGSDVDVNALSPAERKKLKDGVFRNGFQSQRLMRTGKKELQHKNYSDKEIAMLKRPDAQGPDVQTGQPEIQQSQMTPISYLKNFFDRNSAGLAYSQAFETTEGYDSMVRYVDGIRTVSDNAWAYFSENLSKPIRQFNDTGINVGNEKDPFSFFLFFYYADHCETRGTGNKFLSYLENMSPGAIRDFVEDIYDIKIKDSIRWKNKPKGLDVDRVGRQINIDLLQPIGLTMTDSGPDMIEKIYAAYMSDNEKLSSLWSAYEAMVNNGLSNAIRFDKDSDGTAGSLMRSIVATLNYSKKTNAKSLKDRIAASMPGPEYSKVRGAVYRLRYMKQFVGPNSEHFEKMLPIIAKGLAVSSYDELFDPLMAKSNSYVVRCLQLLSNTDNSLGALKTFSLFELPSFNDDSDLTSFEQVVLLGKNSYDILSNERNVNKYGGSSVVNLPNLFIDAGEGLKMLKGSGVKFAKCASSLETFYKTDPHVDTMTFGQLIDYDIKFKDKTQREIFNFLRSKTPGSVEWGWEYNRFEKVDPELGAKSLDITCSYDLGGEKKMAGFEYQGEQHFRPKGVKPCDVSDNPEDGAVYLFTQLRNRIVEKYYSETKKHPSDKKTVDSALARNVVKSVFIEFYDELTNGGMLRERASDRQLDVEEIIDYLRIITSRWRNESGAPAYSERDLRKISAKKTTPDMDPFASPKAESSIPFLGSPFRYLNDIHVEYGKKSDAEKSQLLKKRGWPVAYILPGSTSVTEEDEAATRQLANPSSAVFRWNETGKNELLSFIDEIGITKSSLFEQIIRELLHDNVL